MDYMSTEFGADSFPLRAGTDRQTDKKSQTQLIILLRLMVCYHLLSNNSINNNLINNPFFQDDLVDLRPRKAFFSLTAYLGSYYTTPLITFLHFLQSIAFSAIFFSNIAPSFLWPMPSSLHNHLVCKCIYYFNSTQTTLLARSFVRSFHQGWLSCWQSMRHASSHRQH